MVILSGVNIKNIFIFTKKTFLMALEDIDARFQFDTDCYFYIYYEGDTLFYGGNFKEGDLLTMLKHFYDEEITAHPDLIELSKKILKDTGN